MHLQALCLTALTHTHGACALSVVLQFARKHSGSNSAAADDAACIKDYSQPYLDRWRALQGTYCNASTSDAVSSSSSHVQCYAHPEADLSTCMVQNLFLSSTIAFLGDTPHTSELPQPAPGSIRLACNRSSTPSQFLRGRLQTNEGSRAWLVTAPSFGSPSTQLQRSCSSQQAVPHPVLFLLRVDPENSFHNLETVISVFSTLAVLKLEPGLLRYGLEVGGCVGGWVWAPHAAAAALMAHLSTCFLAK